MWTYRPQLDGLRTVAVYLVLLFHAGVGLVGGGFVGVDVFFVLSGFLVSNVILSEIDRTGHLSLGNFYSRRVRRLLPAAVLVVVVTCVLFLLIGTVVRRLPLVGDARASLLYYANWHFLAQSNDYFAAELDPSPFLHFWSLSIEEQFYVFFPVMLLLLSKTGRRWGRTAAYVIAGLLGLSLVAQLVWAGIDVNHAYYGTDARLYQLFAGALLAVVLRSRPRPVSERQAAWAMLGGTVVLAVFASGLLQVSPTWRGIAACVASVALIGSMMQLPGGWLTRVLSRPTPVYLGKISYGTYLWHWPVIVALKQLFTVGPWTIAVIAFGVSSGLAALSFQVFESPIRRTPALAAFRWRSVAAGLSVSLLAALLIVPPLLHSDRRPALASAGTKQILGGAAGNKPVPKGIDFKRYNDDVGTSRSCPASDPQACIVVRGKDPSVLLVGDSYGKMLAPMLVKLAHEHDLTLSENIVSGCSWAEGMVNLKVTKAAQARCYAAREQWYDKAVPALKPDILLLIAKPRDNPKEWGHALRARTGPTPSLQKLLLATYDATLTHLEKLEPRLLIVRSMMDTGGLATLDCLAGAQKIGECAVPFPKEPVPSDSYLQTAATESDTIYLADFNPVICPGESICLPYRDGSAVWRDKHHLTVSFAMRHREQFFKVLTATGAFRGLG